MVIGEKFFFSELRRSLFAEEILSLEIIFSLQICDNVKQSVLIRPVFDKNIQLSKRYAFIMLHEISPEESISFR